MADDFIQDDFIQIPSFLADDITTESIVQPMATGCTDWCEAYDECCGYEKCMGCQGSCLGSCETCQDCQTTCQNSCQDCQGIPCQTSQSPADNAVLTISNITTNSALATVTGLDSTVPYYINLVWYLNDVYKGTTTTTGSSSSKQFTGLSAGTRYRVYVEIWNGEEQIYLDYLWKNFDTLSLPKLPTPTLDTTQTVKTSNSISVTINAVTGADTYYARINGGTAQTSSGRTFTFSGLQPDTQYLIEIKVSGSGYEDSDWAGYYATTLSAELWEWQYPKTQGVGFNVTPEEWLAFCNKINVVRISKGLLAYPFTTSSTYIGKDKPFYAWIWLEAANAINQINGQVASACLNVSSGDDIYAWYFENLKTALNNAISSLTP